MSITEITAKVTEYQEPKRMLEEIEAEMSALQDEIKAHMGDSELLNAGPYKVSWKPVTTSRIDTAAIKKDHPELAAEYTKTSTCRRFTVQV